MFNIGAGEMALIAVVALLLLGPKRLPELARGIGKFMREFRRQTDEVRGVVEREFYRMDSDLSGPAPSIVPAQGATATTSSASADPALPEVTEVVHSQATSPLSRDGDEPASTQPPPGQSGV